MTIEIKNVEFNSDLFGFEIYLKDGRTAYIQAEQEQNRLSAYYKDYYICNYEPDFGGDDFSDDELSEILRQANKLEDVKKWFSELNS